MGLSCHSTVDVDDWRLHVNLFQEKEMVVRGFVLLIHIDF